MWDLYSKGQVTTSQLKVERWRRTLATRQFEVLTAVCEELERNYLEILAKGTKMIPGISEMLKRLVKSNLIAVLSNGFEKTQYLKLRNSGLSKFITRTIVSEEIGINKPDQRLFNYAIEETGARPPFLMIGDNPDSDILGAMKAGWHAIWYNPKQIPFPYSDAELESLDINPSLLFAVVNDIEGMEKEIRRFHHEMPN